MTDGEKKQAIIEAATELFLKQGYGRTSMEAIACRAGVAKQTLYSYFSGKEDLFSKIVRQRCEAIFDSLPAPGPDHDEAGPYLQTLALRLMDTLFTDETLELYRLVVAETPRFPELGRAYYEAGPRQGIETVAACFRQWDLPGEACHISARLFLGMLVGEMLTHALLDRSYRPSEKDKEEYSRKAVALTLHWLNN